MICYIWNKSLWSNFT